ncbi:MAG: hypothetical protein H6963_12595 [Chromatiaceae bacterium]|nr:hypothetical protein [Chromatiaceae bacterium]
MQVSKLRFFNSSNWRIGPAPAVTSLADYGFRLRNREQDCIVELRRNTGWRYSTKWSVYYPNATTLSVKHREGGTTSSLEEALLAIHVDKRDIEEVIQVMCKLPSPPKPEPLEVFMLKMDLWHINPLRDPEPKF